MEELWYPPKAKYEPRQRKVTEKEIDFLSNTRIGRGKIHQPRKFKIGQVYTTSQSDAEIVHYQGGESVCVKMLDSGQIIEHYPVRAVFSLKKQPKEIHTMQAATQQQIAQFNQASSLSPITFGVVPAVPKADVVTMTSLELVDFINELRKNEAGYTPLRHDHFMAKVPRVIGESMSPKFSGVIEQPMPQGGTKQRNIYRFPKREATLMAMSYSNEISAQVYDKMEALEKRVAIGSAARVPSTMREALMIALELQDVIDRQNEQLVLAAPKVAFVENFVSRGDALTATIIGKKLNVSAQALNKWLIRKNVLFLTRKHFCQWYLDKGYGVEKFVSAANSETGKVVSAIYHTPAGAEWIMNNFNRQEV